MGLRPGLRPCQNGQEPARYSGEERFFPPFCFQLLAASSLGAARASKRLVGHRSGVPNGSTLPLVRLRKVVRLVAACALTARAT